MRVLILDEDRDFLEGILPGVEREFVIDVAYSTEDGEYLCCTNDYDSRVVSSSTFEESPTIQKYPNLLVLADGYCLGQSARFLDKGADVVLNKPVDHRTITAQIRAMVRKKVSVNAGIEINNAEVVLNLNQKCIFIGKVKVELRRKEYQILEYLFVNKNRVVSEEEILEHVWNDGIYTKSNTLAVHIRSIRLKVLECGGVCFIDTVRNFGYIVRDLPNV